jgi:hypothetical protein
MAMPKPKFPAMSAPKGSLLHNDDSHNFADLNGGGGPSGVRNKPSVGMSDRTGAGTRANGRNNLPAKPSGATHSTAGNPASRGGFSGEARGGAFNPDMRVPGHGGSPQHREREIPGDFHKRGGVGAMGQENVPGGHSSGVRPSSGNTRGRSQQLIAGRFKRGAMGARSSGSAGNYGGSPVTSNT